MGLNIALVTDAWEPQMNGVVRTLTTTVAILRGRGHNVTVISPDQFWSVPCPSYGEIRLALTWPGTIGRMLAKLAPDAIHIATEGPLGLAARNFCVRRGISFTTAYHTDFPHYLAKRTKLPPAVFWPFIRWFHKPAAGVMVATDSVRQALRAHGLTRLRHWGRGVDLECFTPNVAPPDLFLRLPRPIQLYVGRVAIEKNIEAFLRNGHPGSMVVVGDGPALADLSARFPRAYFLGRQTGDALAACYAGADVFVFPSKTDTFGLVMIEALACGTPVAAFPVTGPVDVLNCASGAMNPDLEQAIADALQLNRDDCHAHGRSFSWEVSADQFLAALACPAEYDTHLAAAPIAT